MAILLKHGGRFYEIPDEVLARSAIPKDDFESKLRELDAKTTAKGATGLGQYELLDLSDLPDEQEQ
jgi:hypothetical protein